VLIIVPYTTCSLRDIVGDYVIIYVWVGVGSSYEIPTCLLSLPLIEEKRNLTVSLILRDTREGWCRMLYMV